ncbi:hypothetical protein A3770_02p12520 [Chloropicon primus]|uniref:Uncharacterized protein n=1 Tax=Chloropicon primus TaxID=1764295 RepID=A0A5B8MEZ4_9CHLO|nr:hypothetical protein A3770_02p12520 [Chloropicon primus]|mmetsp:Transcript_3195/g.8855  ORF Transcript_3195/g.8855 Transcript_3195/m.8855 type:complete len:191 (+) Transcript_3195:180-752(+)|eukprot:QDZ18734.1 hypothetical protein A3770_02p12520 [Chloropicon primus]
MLKTWVVGDDQVLSHTKGKGKHKKGGTKLHRIASEPYSVQVQRMQEVHRTLTDSASYHSANALDDKEEDSRQKRRHAPLQRRPSLKRPWKGDGCGGSRVSPVKKSVTWIDKEIPGRSISEYHLITPRSFRSDRGTWRDRSSVAVQNRSQSRISLHTNQQLQYYYYHQQASKSRSSCSTCMGTLRTFWFGI